MKEKFPSVGTCSAWTSTDEPIAVAPIRQIPYSQCTREGDTAYPASHKYRDVPSDEKRLAGQE